MGRQQHLGSQSSPSASSEAVLSFARVQTKLAGPVPGDSPVSACPFTTEACWLHLHTSNSGFTWLLGFHPEILILVWQMFLIH